MQLPNILLVLIIIFSKSHKDILQGVSKLDCLAMISMFQKPKFKQNNEPPSIGTSVKEEF
jgi:hypothetical protein